MARMRWVGAIVLLLLCSATVRAQMSGIATIEWLATDADVVLLGEPVSTEHSASISPPWTRYLIQVRETLKGERQSQRIVLAPGWRNQSAEGLYFLVAADRVELPNEWKDEKDAVILRGDDQWFAPHRPVKAFDCSFAMLTTYEQVIVKARVAAAYPNPCRAAVAVNPNAAAGSRPFIFPADGRWRQLVEKDPAANIIWDYHRRLPKEAATRENVAMFRRLLSNNATQVQQSSRWPVPLSQSLTLQYTVRQSADAILRGWKVDPGPVVTQEAYPSRRPLAWWIWAIPMFAMAGAMILARRAASGGRAFAFVSTVSIFIWIGIVLLQVPKARWMSVIATTLEAEHEVSVVGRQLKYLRVETKPDPASMTWAVSEFAEPHHLSKLLLKPSSSAGISGAMIERGQTVPGLGRFQYNYSLLTLSFPFLMAVTGFLPALWLMLCTSRIARRWVRRRKHRCQFCGYDLRGSTGATCPECGRSTTSTAS